MWYSQGGGTFNTELGALGSMLLINGGHNTWSGSGVIRFDIATGKWSQMYDFPYCSVDKTIVGGTVATLTGTVAARTSSEYNPPGTQEDGNLRVGERGNYCRYADNSVIPGTGPLTGGLTDNSDVTLWLPSPIHSGEGIRALPADAGGGSNGSLLVFGHDQTGVRITQRQMWKFNCATNVWDRPLYIEDYNTGSIDSPMLEYDPNRKIMWAQYVTGRLFAVRYINGFWERVRLTGPSINHSASAQPGLCYMPNRDMMVWIMMTTAGTPDTNNINYRWPKLQGLKFNGTTWDNLAAFNGTAFDLRVNGDAAAGNGGYLAGLLAGTNTGWPSWRKTGNVYPLRSTYAGETTYLGCADGGDLVSGGLGRFGSFNAGVNDRLMYCEYDGCLYMIERALTTPVQQYIRIWKLTPPPIGSETTGSWDWSYEDVLPMPGCAGYAIDGTFQSPSFAGKFEYVPSIKCFIQTCRPEYPVQAIRRSSWV